jgi:hypothetical protein
VGYQYSDPRPKGTYLRRDTNFGTHTLERKMIWRDLETVAPEIARLGKERFDRARVALLGTLRKDGSPRISPVEPYLTRGAAALRRDVLVAEEARPPTGSALCAPQRLRGFKTLVPPGKRLIPLCEPRFWTPQA